MASCKIEESKRKARRSIMAGVEMTSVFTVRKRPGC